MTPRLPRSFYERDPATVARALLGQRLVRVDGGRRLAGLIVEVEAYLGPPDKAAHTYQGRRTARNESMWRAGGHAYVYFIYGMHHCLNVVAGRAGDPVAVLVRALEPVEGLDLMRRRRRAARRDTDLCSGPARLTQAMAIDLEQDGVDMTTSARLFIERTRDRPCRPASICARPRVGVGYAQEWAAKPLRFYCRGNPHVSVP